jgi:hypothetical protein
MLLLDSIREWLKTLTVSPIDGESIFRSAVVSQANRVQDWSMGKTASMAQFRAFMGCPPKGSQWDLDRPFHIVNNPDGSLHHTEGCSTCGLGARAISYGAGVLWPEYTKPYDYLRESVFKVMQNHASRFKALRTGKPNVGDHFIIGSGYGTHMGTCTGVEGNYVSSVDAGQTDMKPDPGRKLALQCFKLIVRDWSRVKVVCVIDTWKCFQGFAASR